MRVVLAVAEMGSVRAAADAVGLTPSAVSKHVRRVEDQLGRELFLRSRAGLAPNAEGEAIAGFARRFLALAGEMGARFGRELVAGRVRLGITDDVGLARMPELIRRCTAIHPGLRIELTVAHSSELRDLMAARSLDLAILSDGGFVLPNDAIPLGRVPLVWIARPGWRDEGGALSVAVSEEGCRWRAAALAALRSAGRPFDIRCTSKAMSGQQSAVRVGLSVAPVPASVASADGGVEIVGAGLPRLPDCCLGLIGDVQANRAVKSTADEIKHVFGMRATA
ncbi:LysR family transcriptional regulator [Boseongicola sp. H5]|uniref:LysR family transcriptional regulator n=1 Tax=Boseongicola sp. H5 TaxID=2763261 RepID=UPI001D0A5F67|nr:LysR family transcriptional regulator [Boseongicola sp. H5]